jgi:hypothetical protein
MAAKRRKRLKKGSCWCAGGLLALKCLPDNDVAGVAPLLQVMLHLKILTDNDVADVAPFFSYMLIGTNGT